MQKTAFLFPGQGSQSLGMMATMAEEAEAKRLLFTHHDPTRSDDELDGIVSRVRDEALARGCTVEMEAAAEGTDITLEN